MAAGFHSSLAEESKPSGAVPVVDLRARNWGSHHAEYSKTERFVGGGFGARLGRDILTNIFVDTVYLFGHFGRNWVRTKARRCLEVNISKDGSHSWWAGRSYLICL